MLRVNLFIINVVNASRTIGTPLSTYKVATHACLSLLQWLIWTELTLHNTQWLVMH